METIKEAAINFAQTAIGTTDFDRKIGFEAGVKWAQQWISFEEELPQHADYTLVRNSANIRLVVFDLSNPANRRIDENNFAIDGICYCDWRAINFE